jgi:FkbM family methyltransferase
LAGKGNPRVFPISSLLPPLPPIKIVDVGAMTLGKGTEPYAALLKAVPCEVIGFEPVAAELEKLRGLKLPGHTFLPHMIGDGSARTFYECNYPMTSSLFEPNTELLAKFQNLEELTRVTKTHSVATKRLDDIPEVAGTDFLKVDVQGAELMVFRGGGETLKNVLVIQTEVEFVPMYKGQALFADIDAYLREQGFLMNRLWPMGRTFKPFVLHNDVSSMSQMLWAETIYVRDFMTLDRLAPAALLKLAVILHENYNVCDLAALALETYDRKNGSSLQPAYLRRMAAPND